LVEQLIRNQQVVGSNPTGGSNKSSKYEALKVHLGSHSVDLSRTVRTSSVPLSVSLPDGLDLNSHSSLCRYPTAWKNAGQGRVNISKVIG
jgi:hypothetical protein